MRLSTEARFEMIARCRMIIGDAAGCRIALFTFLILQAIAGAQPNPEDVSTANSSILAVDPIAIEPLKPQESGSSSSASQPTLSVQWKTLLSQSLRFTLIEHAFRYATEPATRHPGQPFFHGYIDAVGALHGWADGDPFYVNYVGHPMQGGVSGFLWTLNDTRYRNVEFGRNPDYWKSRIRAAAFAWAYSEQFEIGPVSEATIGNVQAFFPQQGFVDHVVTPVIGLGWILTEDALDKYLVRRVERKTKNRYVRVLVRGGANPTRSLANVISGQWPWARPRDRGEVIAAAPKKPSPEANPEPRPGVAPFEFAPNAYLLAAAGGACVGGGATAAFRISAEWQAVLDINGCKMAGLEKDLTGDSFSYMAGPRWTPAGTGRLVPYMQVLLGGNKLTQERMFPEKEAALSKLADSIGAPPPTHDMYTQQYERDGFALAAGMGLDLHFNRALGFRLIGVEYTHSWMNDMNGFAPRGFQLKTGMVLRMGTW
jgi:hypothetical protein